MINEEINDTKSKEKKSSDNLQKVNASRKSIRYFQKAFNSLKTMFILQNCYDTKFIEKIYELKSYKEVK
jgi:hypothetical protein